MKEVESRKSVLRIIEKCREISDRCQIGRTINPIFFAPRMSFASIVEYVVAFEQFHPYERAHFYHFYHFRIFLVE